MFRLQAFGGLMLADSTGTPVACQRRRLALLTLIASAYDRGMTRDKLVACLWAESPAEPARHALEQLVYTVRRHTAEDLFLGPDPLRLNPVRIVSDLDEFRRALARDELAEAIAVYRGPFLDGFYLTEAPEFERWTEEERVRLAEEHARALHHLAKQADARGQHTVEIDCRRKLATLDPLGERTALALVRALAGAGDWAGAFQQARAYETRFRQELGVRPMTDLAAELERLRGTAAVGRPSIDRQRYHLEQEIGRGALATVHQAQDRKLNRAVAIKLLRPEVASATDLRRFAVALEAAGGEKLSLSGFSLANPDYMSPEQGGGGSRVDGRSDLYSLGCVLYEMLAGAPPFTGATAQSVLARHARDSVPPLRTVRPAVPVALEHVVLRTLAKLAADRFATAAQFGEALRGALA